MPGISAVDLTRLLKAAPDAPWVAIVSLSDGPEYHAAAAAAGADGFLPKGELTTRLPSLLRTCSAASR